MQDYISLRIDAVPCSEDITDLLAAFLGDIGYESFTPDENGVTAFVKNEVFDKTLVNEILSDFPIPCKLSYTVSFVEGKDWNEEWEKHYFKPILIDDVCVVHSSFHKDIPKAQYDIVVDPKMAFGTGHHSTTLNMMRHILESDMEGKKVIDMGAGTGILGILCAMKGASSVVGIEIDPFACENAVENAGLNNVPVSMICGDASSLDEVQHADFFLANINRNVITADIEKYVASLKVGGTMFLSGFYSEDIPIVKNAAANVGLVYEGCKEDNNWVALRFVKSH